MAYTDGLLAEVQVCVVISTTRTRSLISTTASRNLSRAERYEADYARYFHLGLTLVQMSESIFTGPGEVLLAPETWGDIVPINLDGTTPWFFGKHAFLGATRDIVRTNKTQSFGKALCKLLTV